jgi:hypothetical protein
MRIPRCIELEENIHSSYKPGVFYDWREYLLNIALIPIGIGIIFLLISEINRLTTTYFFTTKRVLQESNLFSKKISIPYHMIEDLHFHQTKIDYIFNTGTIIIETSRRKNSEMIMKNIPNPLKVKKLLEDKIHEAKLKNQ